MNEVFIDCERFGGRRPALACIHFDRYKPCRRYCKPLAKWMEDNPDYQKQVEAAFGVKSKQSPLMLASRSSGKLLPDRKLACPRCRFVAKTPRGLKTHQTRSHTVRA